MSVATGPHLKHVPLTERKYSVGIDLSETAVRLGMFAPDMSLLSSMRLHTRMADGPEAAVADMKDALRLLEAAQDKPAGGIGIGLPGTLDVEEGKLCRSPNFPGWVGFPLRQAAQEAFGVEVVLETDANVAALAESATGAGFELGINSLCMITLGPSIGSGLMLDGKVWHGALGLGGEIGHVSIDPKGDSCQCGTVGCFELYASVTAVANMARRRGLKPESAFHQPASSPADFSVRKVADLASAGNTEAQAILDRVGEAIGMALASTANLLDLPLYVIGGAVAVAAWELFAPRMYETLSSYSSVFRLRQSIAEDRPEFRARVVPARCGANAALLGAALLTRQDDSRESDVRLDSQADDLFRESISPRPLTRKGKLPSDLPLHASAATIRGTASGS